MWTWNDFKMPLVPVSYLMVLLPMFLIYILCQKWIMNGVVADVIK